MFVNQNHQCAAMLDINNSNGIIHEVIIKSNTISNVKRHSTLLKSVDFVCFVLLQVERCWYIPTHKAYVMYSNSAVIDVENDNPKYHIIRRLTWKPKVSNHCEYA